MPHCNSVNFKTTTATSTICYIYGYIIHVYACNTNRSVKLTSSYNVSHACACGVYDIVIVSQNIVATVRRLLDRSKSSIVSISGSHDNIWRHRVVSSGDNFPSSGSGTGVGYSTTATSDDANHTRYQCHKCQHAGHNDNNESVCHKTVNK